MKKIYLSVLACTLAASTPAFAGQFPAGPDSQISIDLTDFTQEGDLISATFAVNTTGVKMPSKVKTVYQPMMVNFNDTACFPNFAVDGRKRWNFDSTYGTPNNVVFQGWGKESGSVLTTQGNVKVTPGTGVNSYNITVSMPYSEWMGDATLVLDAQFHGCSACDMVAEVQQEYFAMAQADFLPLEYAAEFIYATPAVEPVKLRDFPAQAYFEYRVGQTNILPKLGNNTAEIAKVKASIDSIKNDKDIEFQGIHINGMASPEGPYANNVRLAKGRTEAMKAFVIKEYKFPKDFITTSWEPAINWEGLREWLTSPACQAQSANLPNAGDILAIVNSDMEDFARNQKIKTTYPDQYNWLLKNVYPQLRVSNYDLKYEVRVFETVDEMVEVYGTNPQKLSVAELVTVANANRGIDDAYFTAADIYTDDEVANTNAGVHAMTKGDLSKAEKYLNKAGDKDEAKYAKAQLAALKGQNEKALKEFKALEKSSNPRIAQASANAAASLERIVKAKKR